MSVFEELQTLFETKRLPNSILITGWSDEEENHSHLQGLIKLILNTDNLNTHSDYQYLESHKVAEVRKLLEKLSLKPFGNRVVVLSKAEELTPESVNTLLKEIEEPQPNTYFIVLTNHEQKLLPTLRSRLSSFAISAAEQKNFDKLAKEFTDQKTIAKRLNWLNKMNEEETADIRQFLKELFLYSRDQFNQTTSPLRFKIILKCFEYLESNVKPARVLSFLAVSWK